MNNPINHTLKKSKKKLVHEYEYIGEMFNNFSVEHLRPGTKSV